MAAVGATSTDATGAGGGGITVMVAVVCWPSLAAAMLAVPGDSDSLVGLAFLDTARGDLVELVGKSL